MKKKESIKTGQERQQSHNTKKIKQYHVAYLHTTIILTYWYIGSEHYHCTRFDGQCSSITEVKASVIQGSALGPASYVVTAADLHPVTPANCL